MDRDQKMSPMAKPRQPLRGADGKFISERVVISQHHAEDHPVDPAVSPSVVPMYHPYDSTLQTRYRQTPLAAPKAKPAAPTRSRHRAPISSEEMWNETICDGGKAALAIT